MASQDDRVTAPLPEIGFIGLGDEGGPMAVAIAEAGYPLHTWARSTASLDVLAGVPYTAHGSPAELGAACDIVGLCVSEDADVRQILDDGLLAGLRPRSVVVNHGTGVPSAAVRVAEQCAGVGVDALDAPVSGARAGALARTLTTMVGGPEAVALRCRPVFETFSAHVVHMGGPGSGQLAKLFNNALMMMNQANIEEVVGLAGRLGVGVPALVDLLKVGSATSFALEALGTAITPDNVHHLQELELLDMELFAAAMDELGAGAGAVTQRAVTGARGLVDLMRDVGPRVPAPTRS